MALSGFGIRALKPKAEHYSVSDGQGLGLEVLPSGALTWRYRYSLHVKKGKVALGKYPVISTKAARKPGRICGDAGSWKSPSAHKRAVKVALFEAMSVHEFGEWYFKEIVCRDVKNPSGIRRYLDKEITRGLPSAP